MAYKIYGAAAVEAPDKVGDTILVRNIDITDFRAIDDEHESQMFSLLGGITFSKKILTEKDCENPKQRKVFESAERNPCLYFEGELVSEHPNAKAAWELICFANNRPDLKLKVGASIEGGVLQRNESNKKIIEHSLANAVALTIKPCNPKCHVFPEGDLRKSYAEPTALPMEYFKALSNAQETPSIKVNPARKLAILQKRFEVMKKSLEDYKQGTMISLKCHHCNQNYRMFKNSSDIPNRCRKCGKPFL